LGAASYIAVLFHIPLGRSFDILGSLGSSVAIGVFVITVVGLFALFIPCYLGIRLGATFATILGVTSMVPLTLLILLPAFKPSVFHWSNISGFHYADPKTAGTIFFLGWIFVISWNAIAMEAAACYVGECRDPRRDAKIALTAEGIYGVFVYIGTAIVFVGVLGAALQTSDPLTLYTSFCDHIFGNAGWVKYLIGLPLIMALLLSVLNAIMGVSRSLFQASEDRILPRFFMHKNKHHVPDRAMFFTLICAIVVGMLGSPVRIYIFSNVGYIIAVAGSLYGYFIMRQMQPERSSPFRMPGWFRFLALACALFLTFDYFVGGWNSPNIVVGPGTGHSLYILGFVVVAAYFPLYFYRRWSDRYRWSSDRQERSTSTRACPGPRWPPKRSRVCPPCRRRICDGGSALREVTALGLRTVRPRQVRAAQVRQAAGPTGCGAHRIERVTHPRSGRALGTTCERRSAGGGGEHRPSLRIFVRTAEPWPDADQKGADGAAGHRGSGGGLHREGRHRILGPSCHHT
jgi:amino acid transporter